PYALLGVTPADCEAAQLELRVQDRMKKLRCYQLSHPDEATEGMNRVAQAFVSLIERHGTPPTNAKSAAPPRSPDATPAIALEPATLPIPSSGTQSDWASAPPPIRSTRGTPLPALPVEAEPVPTTSSI